MTTPHTFILSSGCWLGEGKISIKGAAQPLKFYTKWEITKGPDDLLIAKQTVELQDVEEHVVTSYTFSDIRETAFVVELKSESIEQAIGQGIIAPTTLAWEFHSPVLEGFELYERLPNGDYRLHAEFSSTSHYRTIIDGIIWMHSDTRNNR